MPLKYTTEKLNFFYLHSYMKIFQAKRKSSNPKPFPEGRVDFCGAKRRDERYILPYCFSIPPSFCLTAKCHRLTAVRSHSRSAAFPKRHSFRVVKLRYLSEKAFGCALSLSVGSADTSPGGRGLVRTSPLPGGGISLPNG